VKWPWVSRELCESQSRLIDRLLDANAQQRRESAERVDRLLEQLLAMKRDGFATPHRAVVRESPDPETVGLERAEAQRRTQIRASRDAEFVRNATNDIVSKTGVDRQTAAAEAKRLLDESRAEHPAGG
jgi:hypothetical protein